MALIGDGLFLRSVSIVNGERLLAVADGGLTDFAVGKNIAIPGAADLTATITALDQHQVVPEAAMTAGSPRFRGTIVTVSSDGTVNRPPFRPQHAGRRITVAGAGPGGGVLVTDVVAVVDDGTLTLAQAASADVTGVEAHLNAPERAGLSGYARHTRTGLTLGLGDRTVTDGAVTVGGRAVESATARFSHADLGKTLTLAGAGVFRSVVTAAPSPGNRLELRDPAPRAVSGGQADVWRNDSLPDLQAALRSGAEIVLPPGVYDLKRPATPVRSGGVLRFEGLRNVTLRGAGPGATILSLMPGQELGDRDTHVIETIGCEGLRFRDMSVHGAYLTQATVNEQMHGINLNRSTRDTIIEDVRFFQTAGDGLRLLGNPGELVEQVVVSHCRFIQNKRTGVGFQRGTRAVWVRDCHFDVSAPSTDAAIDLEPTGEGGPADIVIDSNVIVHRTSTVAVALSGVSGPDPARRVTFSNNRVDGGTLFSTDVQAMSIVDNVFSGVLPARPVVHVQRGGDTIKIYGNTIGGTTNAAILVSQVNDRPVDRALITGNLCEVITGVGIRVDSSEDVAVVDNLLIAAGNAGPAVELRAEAGPTGGVSVRGNTIGVRGTGRWEQGVQIVARHPLGPVSVTANTIRGAAAAVHFAGTDFTGTPVCALNDGGPVTGLTNLPGRALMVSGAGALGGGRVLVGEVAPEGVVPGLIGDVYQRIGTAPGPRLFVKESADKPETGWVAT
ncbi:hypothetical protein ACIA8K_18735 [Catenuloplanes sp. NPDC051500]|uniref:hypothetical protein n=1 Tax=Catenuloplanes sp. NPDC051500 TaxID=3363959 RepID=UPI003799A34C